MINPHRHTEQEILNSSFDETLGVQMVEIIGADGVLQNMGGMNIPAYDEIAVTYPTTATEVYTYKLATVTVATITVTYSDAVSKLIISSVVKS